MNTVEFPLNKKEKMIEYCVTIDNFTSDLVSLSLQAQFVDDAGNVLAEDSQYLPDIPGKKSKTTYGTIFVENKIAKDIDNVNISAQKAF